MTVTSRQYYCAPVIVAVALFRSVPADESPPDYMNFMSTVRTTEKESMYFPAIKFPHRKKALAWDMQVPNDIKFVFGETDCKLASSVILTVCVKCLLQATSPGEASSSGMACR